MMYRFCTLAGLFLAGLTVLGRAADDGKGTRVDLDGLTSTTPAKWEKETPSNRMRFAQFKLPKVKGDKEDGELVIFKGLGGTAAQNVDRWKKQFTAPAGKSINDVSKVTEIKIGGSDATRLDIEGTYMFNPAPFNPASKPVARPNYKMIAIQMEGPKDVYQIRLTGPAKTVDSHKADFDKWIKEFKK